jgi:hypothetical protein
MYCTVHFKIIDYLCAWVSSCNFLSDHSTGNPGNSFAAAFSGCARLLAPVCSRPSAPARPLPPVRSRLSAPARPLPPVRSGPDDPVRPSGLVRPVRPSGPRPARSARPAQSASPAWSARPARSAHPARPAGPVCSSGPVRPSGLPFHSACPVILASPLCPSASARTTPPVRSCAIHSARRVHTVRSKGHATCLLCLFTPTVFISHIFLISGNLWSFQNF